jgi:NitT/TauT family transport system ATP-binding protein
MIEIDGIVKIFRSLDGADVLALKQVSLSIRRNEFVSIVGPSGCGKSTLLRLIAGLIPPSAGTVKIDGTEVDAPRRDVGIVFQSPTLLPWLNVLANVLFPLKVFRRLDGDSKARAYDLLKLVGLGDFAKKMPSELSGGMQQRAAICRALIHDPGILLMDEPFGALDALTREEMSLELLRIWSERPKTIVFITHSVPEAVLLADRSMVMTPRPGRIAEVIEIPLPRPRSYEQESERDFHECTRRIRQHIFGSQRAAQRVDAA